MERENEKENTLEGERRESTRVRVWERENSRRIQGRKVG